MKLIRNSKLLLASVVLAVGGLGVAATTAPAAHAASATISATGQGARVIVQGSGFNPGGSVRVEVLDTSWNLLATQYVTAGTGGGAGWFYTILSVNYVGNVIVMADGAGSSFISATTYIYPLPFITAGPGNSCQVEVDGWGFTPGTFVYVSVDDSQHHVLAHASVYAAQGTAYVGDIYACFTGLNLNQTLSVVAFQYSPLKESNWATYYLP